MMYYIIIIIREKIYQWELLLFDNGVVCSKKGGDWLKFQNNIFTIHRTRK